MSFILTPARVDCLFASVARQIEMTKIFQDGSRAATEDFNALFGKRSVAVSKVADGSLRTVRETDRYKYVVTAVPARIRQGPRFHLNDGRRREEHQQVDEVADLAQNSAASLLGIVEPMVGRKVSGVDAIVQGQGFGYRSEK